MLIVVGSLAGVVVLVVAGMFAWSMLGSYSRPEAVFETAKQAAQKDDWETFCSCLTDEARDALAGMMAASAGMLRGIGQFAAIGGAPKSQLAKEKIQPVIDVLNAHGLDEAAFKGMPAFNPMTGPPSGDRLQQLLAPIKNRNRFVGDVIRALKQVSNRTPPMPLLSDARLEDVKVDGDTASRDAGPDSRRPRAARAVQVPQGRRQLADRSGTARFALAPSGSRRHSRSDGGGTASGRPARHRIRVTNCSPR